MAWLAADAVPDPSLVVDYGQVVAGAAVDRPLGEDGESSEQALLAALMTQPAAARDLCGWLRAEDFGDERLGRIYAVLVEQELRNEPQIAGRGEGEHGRAPTAVVMAGLVAAAESEQWPVD
ncbi:DnaB-like helicase N-terminal domain-containing protein [Kitasatospora paranensis]|uniref:DnaB-like helicase N-terminal domain-containing protein n=1 Tax=Kitasatospora paranensis TaxID=258053 RepID=A0ABW2G7Y3_9ACTN